MAFEGGPVPCHPHHGLHGVGGALLPVQAPGPILFHLLGLLHGRALHRRGHGADPARQGGHGHGRGRGERVLGVHGHVRLHGRFVDEAERHSSDRLACLRQGSRRLRHRRGRRHARARGARAREGPWSPHLRRVGGLRSQRRRLRRRRAFGRRRGALHEDRHGDGQRDRRREEDRLRQHARHVDTRGRRAGAWGREASLRALGLPAIRGLDEVTLWPRLGGRGRPRSDLLLAHGG
mmetsp:Transcript_136043/g.352747  ORF Transcript_136043/g.352747 Transcript_136043/m.352747 type:complete len:235 (-) Transcript_136043:141-845(-)